MKIKLLIIFILTLITVGGTASLLSMSNNSMKIGFNSAPPPAYSENTYGIILGQELGNNFAIGPIYNNEYLSYSNDPWGSSPSDDDDELIHYVPVGEGLGILMLMLLVYIVWKVAWKVNKRTKQ